MYVLCLSCISGVVGGPWDVSYALSFCALNGSSVTIPCTYKYPPKQTVEQVCWYKKENTDLSQSEHFKNRIQYLGDTKNNCTLRINGLTESDAKEKYKFWFKTNQDRYAGAAVTLKITGNLHFIKL